MDRLEAMSILIAAIETGSFSAAGRKLGMPLPTVSRKVSELEKHLQTRLLVRSTRKLSLTDAGITYLTACRRILDEVGEAERAASGEYSEPRGDLIVTAPIVFGRLHVLPVVSAFLADHPDIRIRLLLSDRSLHLVDEHIDVAVRIGRLPDSSMVATRVGSVCRVVCASPTFLAAHGTPKSPAELADMPCVGFDGPLAGQIVGPGAGVGAGVGNGLGAGPGAGSGWSFARPGRRGAQMVAVRPRLTVNTAEAAIDAAIAGVGLANVLSYQVARAIAEGRVKRVLRRFEPEPAPVSLMHAGQGLLPLKTRRFLEFAAPLLRKSLPRAI